ncbi:HAD family hydrolase [Deinococcus sp.]|uniref:HAD family hydrolase n=1 Tax=Deinococcus sp. TaxID=47478 RepID=UPI0025B7E652|nr:HAD-IA family hydrolase [Deinococcus sp.]
MTPLAAVLFDRDDTLAYTDPAVYQEAALWLAGQYGLDAKSAGQAMAEVWQEQSAAWWHLWTQAQEDNFWKEYGAELSRRLGLSETDTDAFMQAYPYERFMKPVGNAREVFGDLRARGLKIGVLSNTLPSIGRTLEALGLTDLVDVALATCTLGVHKPEAAAFTLAAQAMQLAPGQILFIDDRLENVEGARAVGMQATQIDLSGQNPQAIHNLAQVLELVQA